MLKKVVLAVGLIAIPSIAPAQQEQCQLECTRVTEKGETRVTRSCHALNASDCANLDAQNQEVTRRVGATSRRIACKIAEVLRDRKTAEIVPEPDATPGAPRVPALIDMGRSNLK